ncbi:MAG TPA: hypothetical protein VIL20_07230 [Sandaracinaceae bacterium]
MAGSTRWILEADEVCEHCGQTYSLELELRCVACDAPLCAFCAVVLGGATRCPDCGEVG